MSRDFDSSENQGFSGGNRAVELQILRAENTDTIKAAKIVDDYLAETMPRLPQSLDILKYDVSADAVEGRISLLIENGLSGLVLVVGILFLFLNARIALWVAAGIPVAMMATIGIMWLMGESINMISLFALIMMLGVIVDDAIVVGEHTATRQSLGDTPQDAAVNGATTMLAPIFAASLTTIAAFLPILLVGDVLGQIMGTLPVVVVAVVIASLIECFLVLPGHLSHALDSRPGWSWWRVVIVAAAPAFFLERPCHPAGHVRAALSRPDRRSAQEPERRRGCGGLRTGRRPGLFHNGARGGNPADGAAACETAAAGL